MSAARLLIEAGLSVRSVPGGGLAVDGLAGLPASRARELLDYAKARKAEILAELSSPPVEDRTASSNDRHKPSAPGLVSPAMIRGYKVARAWLMARWPELEATGWTMRKLFRAGDGLSFPWGPWGPAWLPHWSEANTTPAVEPGGVIVFTIREADGRQARQRVCPFKENRP
jgi:hypothetical protein